MQSIVVECSNTVVSERETWGLPVGRVALDTRLREIAGSKFDFEESFWFLEFFQITETYPRVNRTWKNSFGQHFSRPSIRASDSLVPSSRTGVLGKADILIYLTPSPFPNFHVSHSLPTLTPHQEGALPFPSLPKQKQTNIYLMPRKLLHNTAWNQTFPLCFGLSRHSIIIRFPLGLINRARVSSCSFPGFGSLSSLTACKMSMDPPCCLYYSPILLCFGFAPWEGWRGCAVLCLFFFAFSRGRRGGVLCSNPGGCDVGSFFLLYWRIVVRARKV